MDTFGDQGRSGLGRPAKNMGVDVGLLTFDRPPTYPTMSAPSVVAGRMPGLRTITYTGPVNIVSAYARLVWYG